MIMGGNQPITKFNFRFLILTIILTIQLFFINESFTSITTWSQVNGAQMIAAGLNGDIFVTSSDNIIYQLFEGQGTPIRYAGTGEAGLKDGDILEAKFNSPKGIYADAYGNIYICDSGNNAIRKISKGVVSTITSSLPSAPISVTTWNSDNYEGYSPYNIQRNGLYVTLESGDFYYVDFGPSNDACNFATPLTITTTLQSIKGYTIFADQLTPTPPCTYQPNGQYVWYTFTGNGNQINISTCPVYHNYDTELFIFSEQTPNITTATCEELACTYIPNFNQPCGETSICTQPGMIYYIVVSSYSGVFNLQFQEVEDSSSSCSANCGCKDGECGFNDCKWQCGLDICGSGTLCVDSHCEKYAENSDCVGATSFPASNYSIQGNTLVALKTSSPSTVGDCVTPRYPGLWYKFIGTGDMVTLSTCSSFTDFQTTIHVYVEYGGTCNELYCLNWNTYQNDPTCNLYDTSFLVFCSQPGVTYYYLVEGNGAGAFELTQTLYEPCTPGEGYYSYYENYGYSNSYYYSFSYYSISNYYD